MVRRAVLALAGATAGTTLVIIAKLGTEPRVASGEPPAGTPTAAPSSVAPTPQMTLLVPTPTPGSRTSTPTSTPHPSASDPTKTVAGPSVTEKYGTIQVTIITADGRITDITATYPTGGKTGDINQSAIPQLRQEALTAQSADIATVSGATYTSEAYRESLQGALDRAEAS